MAMRSQPSIIFRQELQLISMPETLSRGNWVETYKHDMAPLGSEYPKRRLTKLDPSSLHQAEDNSGENELGLDQDTSG